MSQWGVRFARAIAGRDAEALRAAMAPDVDFKGLTPGRAWEADSADGVVEVVLGHWFEPQDRIVGVRLGEPGLVADTHRIGYGFDLELPDGAYVVEQQAYYRAGERGIAHLRIVCSGFRPVRTAADPGAGT